MRNPDPSSRLGAFARSSAGSVTTAVALFAVALLALAAFALLQATGRMQAPPLIFAVLGVAVLAAGWDLLRERRKGR
ncbi:hypothetical protein [Roseicyclus persicicus]|uniref:Uncharacterized protein n=1 Tax=Roseicyclus persicicus TaxID=2650661 RepID=A0A7X6GXN7_9RHOB|nr:hypothetical protein [Roseibacterium persicicum]NKX44304.1 hypothetical protein [Roseibacterium persicicum]